MSLYKHVVIAVDLHTSCDKTVIVRGLEVAKANHAKVSLVHAVEHIMNAYGVAEAYSAAIEVEEQLVQEAKKTLQKLGKKFDIAPENQHISVGTPRSEIIKKTHDLKADLLVVGSHGRHGFQLLLGSTANGVLHYAECDVLAVRVKDAVS